MLGKLGEGLKGLISKITGQGVIDKEAIEEIVRDIQRTLLSGDVEVKLVFKLSNRIKQRGMEAPPKGVTTKEHIVNIVYEEIVKLLGDKSADIRIEPKKILMIGLFGSGKTTTSGKLANFYKKRGLKTALIGCDVHRPAAMDQLKQIAEKLQIPYYIDKNEKDASKILTKGLEEVDGKVIIVDSAGRDALDQELIKEIKSLAQILNPEEIMLVIPADIGQIAKKQAEEFKKALNVNGVIITKLDSTAKGGGALSATSATGATIKFIGLGEKIEDLETYDPKRFVSRLLGMGDLETLLEKVREIGVSEKTAEDMMKGNFTLRDFYEQLEAMKKMGPLKKIAEMIPGMGQMNIPDDLMNIQEAKLKKFKFIMESMNKKELEEPDLIDQSRINRIAKGSGTKPEDIRELIKQYKQSKKMLKMFKGGRANRGPLKNILKNFKM